MRGGELLTPDEILSSALLCAFVLQVAAALSDSVRDRQGISTLKCQLVSLQGQLAEAQQRLEQSKVWVRPSTQSATADFHGGAIARICSSWPRATALSLLLESDLGDLPHWQTLICNCLQYFHDLCFSFGLS